MGATSKVNGSASSVCPKCGHDWQSHIEPGICHERLKDDPSTFCTCEEVAPKNGHTPALAVPSDVVITEKAPKAPRPRKPKHVPIAPAGTVPSGEVPWRAVHGGKTETVTSQTWFGARAKAMALFRCEANQCEVKRT